MTENVKTETRIVYLDMIRIFAALMVIFNHTDHRGFMLPWEYNMGSANYYVCVIFDLICLIAVPLYYQISGALLLKREPVCGKKYFGKILQYGIILVVFSIIYYLNLIIPQGIPFDLKALGLMIWDCSVYDHLWFLYSYIAILIILPFLQSMVKVLKDWHFCILLGVGVLFDFIIPCVQILVFNGEHNLYSSIIPTITVGGILFPCMGYFIENRLTEEKLKRWLIPVWVGALFEQALMVFTISVTYRRSGEFSFPSFSRMLILTCMAIMISFKLVVAKIKMSDSACRVISTIGACTFGTYLIHLLFLDRKWMYFIPDKLNEIGCYPLMSGMIYVVCVFIVSLAVTWVIRKIPILKKLVGG